jgi:hypothetical protein
MKLTTRRAATYGTLLAVTLLLSACQNLPRATAGAKCKVVGEHAQDGTWVLKCGPNKRWNKLMTIDAANDAVANWLRSQAPAPTAPPATTTPPPAAATNFGPTNSAVVADRAGAIKPGTYATRPLDGTYCTIEIFGGPTRRRFGKAGPMYIDLAVGDWIKTTGNCRWNLGPVAPQTMPSSGDGMYRVGTEIQPGLYTAPGSTECYWETATRADGSFSAITDIYYGRGPQLVEIAAGEAYFVSDDCGPWTRMTSLPNRFLHYVSPPTGAPLEGLRAFYRDNEFEVSPSSSMLAAGFGGALMTLYPVGGTYAVGDYPISRIPVTPGVMRFDLSGPAGGCNEITGTAHVLSVTVDGGGSPTSMHVLVDGACSGQPFAINLDY